MQTKSMKRFWVIFSGQFVSALGSSISSFGLSIWVLLQTNSTLYFTITYFATMVPNVIFSPITGSIADRKDRKKIIIICDSLDAVLKLFIMLLFFAGKFEVWMVVLFNFLSATLNAFQGPAFYACIPNIVPKDDLGKANSMLMLIQAVKMLVAPVVAGLLYPVIGLIGLFIADFISYGAAILTILPQDLRYEKKEKSSESFYKTIKSDFVETFAYIKNMGGFFKILITTSFINFVANLTLPLIGPLVMSNYDSKIFGFVESSFGIGMLVGSIVSGMLKTKDKVKSIFTSLILSAVFLMTVGISYKWYFIFVGVLFFALPIPRINTLFGTLMQSKISNDMLGKVSALSMSINNLFSPVAVLLSGILADYVFKPLLVKGGSLSDTIVGKTIGVGATRGIGLMFIVFGFMLVVLGVFALNDKKIRSFEKDVPDVIKE